MDNGISILDNELRNLVILYDTKEEFIQMLGRKRKDGENINLYICKRNSNYFRLRLQGIIRKRFFYDKHGEKVDEMYTRRFINQNCAYNCSTNCPFSCIHKCGNLIDCYNCLNNCLNDCSNSCRRTCPKNCQNFCKSVFNVTPYFDLLMSIQYPNYKIIYRNYFVKMFYMQQNILNDILDNDFRNHMIYSLQGFIAINYFSIRKILDLFEFYSDMQKKIEEDELAFVKEQMRWMDIEEDKINETILDMTKGDDDKWKNILIENIEEVLDKELDKDGNIKLKIKIKDAAIYFLKKSEKGKEMVKDCVKNDRPIIPEKFNECMQNAELDYMMAKNDKKTFLIKKNRGG